MDFIANLPEDLIGVLLETLCTTSKVSIVVLSHVNKMGYRTAMKCAIRHYIGKKLYCFEIVSEGSFEVLKWARSNGCCWNWSYYTTEAAVREGYLEIFKWCLSEGCDLSNTTAESAIRRWPYIFPNHATLIKCHNSAHK